MQIEAGDWTNFFTKEIPPDCISLQKSMAALLCNCTNEQMLFAFSIEFLLFCFSYQKEKSLLSSKLKRLLKHFEVIRLGLEPRAHTLKVYCSTN